MRRIIREAQQGRDIIPPLFLFPHSDLFWIPKAALHKKYLLLPIYCAEFILIGVSSLSLCLWLDPYTPVYLN